MTADVPKPLSNHAHKVYIISDVKIICLFFFLFHLSVTKHSPRRGIEGTKWVSRGYTGTHMTPGEANAQINPGTNKLTDLTRRDNHVRNIRRYPILPREHSPRLMEALARLGPGTRHIPRALQCAALPSPQ